MTHCAFTPRSDRRVLATAAALLLLLAPGRDPLLAFDDGPPAGFAGDPPGYNNCTLCHADYPLNSGDGSLAILGLPGAFVPGTTYDLMVRLQDPGQARWGFELTVLDAANQQAGTLSLTDPVRTQLIDFPGTNPDYVEQTHDGTYAGMPNGPVVWPFRWTAPDMETVTFYVAGNAADGTFDPGNDYIYTSQVTVEQGTIAVDDRTWGGVKALYARR
jgi:hypothetical protein